MFGKYAKGKPKLEKVDIDGVTEAGFIEVWENGCAWKMGAIMKSGNMQKESRADPFLKTDLVA